MHTLPLWLGLSFVASVIEATTEYLHNADFEKLNTSFSGNWVCEDCIMTSYSADVYHGSKSIKVTNRHYNWSSPQANINVPPGHNYVARMYFKLLNIPQNVTTVEVDLMAAVNIHGKIHGINVAVLPYQELRYGWTEISGDFFVPTGTTSVKLFLQVTEPSVDYLLDDCSLQQLPQNQHWHTDAVSRISNTRKAAVSIRMAHGTQANDIFIQLVQQRHTFPFGTAVKASFLVDDAHQAYQNFVFNNFNWAVLENALKWSHVERSEGNSQYDTAVAAISTLQSHGLHVRGHNLFWAVDRHSPKWLLGKSHTDYINEMKRHISDIVSHNNGTLDHWDVYNEALHGRYFEKHTGDQDIIQKMFHWLHAAQPQSKLFLNDYKIVPSNLFTTALKNQALQLLKDRVPLYGIGIQSHFKTSQIQKDIIKYRLDKVAEAGLKIWITEMTIFESNSTKKAAALEDLLTLYFSHPAVEGVLLWGFWDGAIRDQERSLFTGPSITGYINFKLF